MTQQRKSKWSTFLLGLMVVVFTIALVVYPQQGFKAGIEGLKVFWDIVFPSLLPFFILAELMLGLGVVRGLGVLLEPLMRPLFGVPGIGAFALSMGLAAGYPMDAVITSRFREQGLCSRVEGERLLAFTNTADPLFMIGAVAVGMFKSPAVGGLIAIAHYISAFLVGVSFKFWGRKNGQITPSNLSETRGNILVRAVREIVKARNEDGRPFGTLLREAVTESMMTLLMICGFIVFFAVLIQILDISGIMKVLGYPLLVVYKVFGIHTGLVNPTLAGVLELDIGTAQVAAIHAAPMIQKLALVSAIIAWSGLAVHAQVAAVITSTDIRMAPYFLARFLHAALAAAITVFLYMLGVGRVAAKAMAAVPAFKSFQEAASGAPWWHVMWSGFSTWFWVLGALLVIGIVVGVLRQTRVIAWRV
ncbi:sporulation integral membrane protein YlbJ [Alicyclobacillus ferrooxydans]|nr:sporulation integral membrane protein YlbJ [Alicyclobacillus ferrooxydans]